MSYSGDAADLVKAAFILIVGAIVIFALLKAI